MIRRIPAAVIVLLVVGACAGPSNHATDMPQLIERLTTAGLSVEQAGDASSAALPGIWRRDGRLLRIEGELVTVFEHPDAVSAKADAVQISPDGSKIGPGDSGTTTSVDWIAPPHFYRNGRLFVLYVGRVDAVTEALEAALGPQFAGR